MGTVLEAKLDRGRGPVATVLVRNGTLRVGDFFICGAVFGKVRAMLERSRRADPRSRALHAGRSARSRIAARSRRRFPGGHRYRQGQADRHLSAKPRRAKRRWPRSSRLTLEQLHKQMEAGEVKELPIILKTDVGGSAEVLTETLQKLSNDKVKVRVLHSGVGAINESDVLLASASNAIIIGFNVRPERNAAALGRAGEGGHPPAHHHLQPDRRDQEGDDRPARAGLQGSLQGQGGSARDVPHHQGRHGGRLPGARMARSRATAKCALLRDNVVVHTGKIGSLRRFKDDVSEVKSGMECGITLENFADVKQGDIIEAFVTERVADGGVRLMQHGGHRRTDAGAAAGRLAFAEREAARGEEPEGPAAA